MGAIVKQCFIVWAQRINNMLTLPYCWLLFIYFCMLKTWIFWSFNKHGEVSKIYRYDMNVYIIRAIQDGIYIIVNGIEKDRNQTIRLLDAVLLAVTSVSPASSEILRPKSMIISNNKKGCWFIVFSYLFHGFIMVKTLLIFLCTMYDTWFILIYLEKSYGFGLPL